MARPEGDLIQGAVRRGGVIHPCPSHSSSRSLASSAPAFITHNVIRCDLVPSSNGRGSRGPSAGRRSRRGNRSPAWASEARNCPGGILSDCPPAFRQTCLRLAGFDAALYLAFISGALVVHLLIVRLVFGVLAGVMTASLFVWAHDAAHGALFDLTRKAEVLGTFAMLPSMQMYRLWSYGHNRVHHGFTSLSPVDWIWRPWTPGEYLTASRPARLVYRIERSLPGCGLHYFLRVWWAGMVRFHGGQNLRETTTRDLEVDHRRVRDRRRDARLDHWRGVDGHCRGHRGAVGRLRLHDSPDHLSPPHFIPAGLFSMTVSAGTPQWHRWPAAPWSTVARSEALTHNISVHTPHHIDTRIPFYRLKEASADLKAAGFGTDIVEYRLGWSSVHEIFKTCKLLDFDTQTWYRFSDLERISSRPRRAVS